MKRLLLAAGLGASTLAAEPTIERDLAHATDIFYGEPVNHNPASGPEESGMHYAAVSLAGKTTYTRTSAGEAPFEQNTEWERDFYAAGYYGVSGTMAYNLQLQRLTRHDESRASQRNMFVTDIWRDSSIRGTANFQVHEQLRVGAGVRLLYIDDEITGNYYLSDLERTSFAGFLYAPEAGVVGKFAGFVFGLSYIFPARGKTEVHFENKIATRSGLIEGAVAGEFSGFGFGYINRRHMYKDGDLYDRTTYPNSDETDISLLGTSFENNYRFPLQEHVVGVSFAMGEAAKLRVSGSCLVQEHNFSPGNNLPGENDDPDTSNVIAASAGFRISPGNVAAEFGYQQILSKNYEENDGGTVHTVTGYRQGLYLSGIVKL